MPPLSNHWLDQVLAVPTIGVLLSFDPELAAMYPQRAASVMRKFQTDGDFNVQAKTPYEVRFQTQRGFSFTFTSDMILVSYKHPSPFEDQAGGFPKVKTEPARPFSEILTELRERAHESYRALLGSESVTVRRVGIVAEAWLRAATPPPGVGDLLKHLGTFWEKPLAKAQAHLLVNLREEDGVTDRCHHRIDFDDANPVKEISFALDWQRVFQKGSPLRQQTLIGIVDQCSELAMAYFQQAGVGTRIEKS